MKDEKPISTSSAILGTICACLSLLLSFFAIFPLVLTVVCAVMLSVDSAEIVDRNWNCGVLIYGTMFLFYGFLALLFSGFTYLLVRIAWWTVLIRYIQAFLFWARL